MEHTRVLLTVNAGSSTIKFALFAGSDDPRAMMRGEFGHAAPSSVAGGVLERAAAAGGRALDGIAHRIVHGGETFTSAVAITRDVRARLDALTALAPNHLPAALAVIDAFADLARTTPQFACFDTAFHRDLPEVSRTLPVPPLPGLRRYGFHGLSYAYVMDELARIAGAAARGRVIVAHLGNGASLAAVLDGRPIDTTMGLTPAGGVVMSTRPGDLDPGVAVYLARARGLTIDALDEIMTHRSGLLAISGRSGDMRELLAHEDRDPRARLAVDVFCYSVRKQIGALAAALGGLDTLVFAGGIGEHAAAIRARCCAGLEFLGVRIDDHENATHAALISPADGRVAVRVIATDEAATMARETWPLLEGAGGRTSPATR